jgi:hypothetical protein
MGRTAMASLALGLALAPARGEAQSLELKPEQLTANVGDILSVDLTVRLAEGQELIDLAPRTLLPPPEGLRLVAADTLRPEGRGVFTGKVRLAFFRVGRQPVPTLALLYRPAPGAAPDTLVHAPLAIEIIPILPAGNPQLKDIKPLRLLGGPVWGPLAMLLTLVAGGLYWLFRRRGPRPAPIPKEDPLPAGPFDVALRRLAEMEQAAIASGNGAVRLFGQVAELVRATLLEAGAIPHQGLTTPEVPGWLPARLAAGEQAGRCERLLGDADLVKFARLMPDLPAAQEHLAAARQLLERWRRVAEGDHAVR